MLRVYYDNLANTIATGLRNPGDSSVFVDFLYALETMHAATILLVGRPFMTVGAALHRFHSRTKNRYRLNLYVYMRLVRTEVWYLKTACRYIDFRFYRDDASALGSVICDYTYESGRVYANATAFRYEEASKILCLTLTDSLTFFVACVRKLSYLLDMPPDRVVCSVVEPRTVKNARVHRDFMSLYESVDPRYFRVCDYLDWLCRYPLFGQ